MIRINLLGQIKPKASRRPVDTGAALPVLFIGAGLVLGLLVLGFLFYSWQRQLSAENNRIKVLQAQKTDLENIKQQVEVFDKQKQVLQQRVSTIEQLQRDRTGGQDLLDMVANTGSRTKNLWLTTMTRKGTALSIEGASAWVNTVDNFITALKRPGYFQKVEIKEPKQDHKNASVQTFNFHWPADISPPQVGAIAPEQAKSANTPTKPGRAATPAKKG